MQDVTPKNIDYTVCTQTAKYCDDEIEEDTDDDDDDNNRDEL